MQSNKTTGWIGRPFVIPVPYLSSGAFSFCTQMFFGLALVFGGAARQGLFSDALVELATLPLLAWAIVRLFSARLSAREMWPLVLLCLIVAIPLLQIIPLPPQIWHLLPGRQEVASAYQIAQLEQPWSPISLDPQATVRSWFSLLPAGAIFIAMLTLSADERRGLVKIFIGVAIVGVAIGILQISGGNLYFYDITNEGMAVGFLANGNHHGTFLASALAFCAAWVVSEYARKGASELSSTSVRVFWLLLVGLLIGAALVGSRAGLALAGLVGVSALIMGLLYVKHTRTSFRMTLLAFSLGAVLFGLFAVAGLSKRNVTDQRDIMEDLRWPVAAVTLQAIRSYLPVGAGLGTFVPVYEMSAPRTQVQERYVNHAHDDWLEIVLETGVVGPVCILAFFVWFAFAAKRAWIGADPLNLDTHLARAASVAIVVMLLHSVVDYPLRSIAVMSVFALSCGLLIPPGNGMVPTSSKKRRHRHSRAVSES